jgi:hypothetical protein
MNGLAWYKSPVYIGIVVNILAGLVNLFKLQDVVTLDILTNTVAGVFTAIAVVAGVIAEWKRRKSAIQPITLTHKE